MSDNSHKAVNEFWIARLIEAKAKKTHNIILLCDPPNLPEFHRLMVQEVILEPDPEDGDIYKHGLSGKWCIHHQGRLKLSMAASMKWERARTIESGPDYIHMQAVGSITKEFNLPVSWSGDCELDRRGLHERLLLEYAEKAAKANVKPADRENWIQNKATKEEARIWANRMKLAATFAKSVVIDKLLNLKSGYKNPNELKRPWFIVRCQVAPDLNDPIVKRQLNMMALQAIAGVFGGPAMQPAIDIYPQQKVLPETCPQQPEDQGPPPPQPDEMPPQDDPGHPDPPPDDDFIPPPPEFSEWPDKEREKAIEDLIKATGYDESKLSRPWRKVTPAMQQQLYHVLLRIEGERNAN